MKQHTDYITPHEVHTLHELFLERVRRTPSQRAYRYFDKQKNAWQDITWQEMKERVAHWYTALKREQLIPGDRVALMLPNSPEWVCFDLAALALGLVVVPLFANDRPENIAYILEQTHTKVLLCPGLAYWNDLDPVLHRLEGIQTIITQDLCQPQAGQSRITCIDHWLAPAQGVPHPIRSSVKDGDTLASIVYTSGTTGQPKGVMLSHRNILENAYAGLQSISITPNDLFLSFLPMSHMLERTVGYYIPIMAGASVAFVRSIPQLGEDLLQIQPTALVAVPRIFERIHARIQDTLEQKSLFLQSLFDRAVRTGWHLFEYKQGRRPWTPSLLLHPLLDTIIAAKVRAQLGGQLRVIISGGAPLASDVARFFLGLGLPLYQGYGLTETSPVISVNRVENNDPSTVGLPLPGVEVKVDDKGELLVKGSCLMRGYWQNPEASKEIMTEDGWLKTGDLARIEEDRITITGRLKEILVLSNSEKIPPADLELAIAMDSLFDQVMVVGEGKPYLTMLAVLNPDHWQRLCAEQGVPDTEESLGSAQVQKLVLARVEQQLQPFPGFAWIKQVHLSLEPWTVENDLLTPTLKLKRPKITALMQEEIDAMYGKKHG